MDSIKSFLRLVTPLGLATLLSACASFNEQTELRAHPVPAKHVSAKQHAKAEAIHSLLDDIEQTTSDLLLDNNEYQLPSLADSILEGGLKLLGTPYVWGGNNLKTGFDCSGFIGYVYRKQAGIELPRTTADLYRMDAPVIARADLIPGDLILFNKRGRGQVSHVGIYMGENKFLHASSNKRTGGVRVDSLSNSYWSASFMRGKRVLEEGFAETAINLASNK